MKTTEEHREWLRAQTNWGEHEVVRDLLDDIDEAIADLAKGRERADAILGHMHELQDTASRLRAELAECRAELASWEKEAEENDLFARHSKADAMMREALGQEMFDRLWGPGLEALGKCVDVALNRAEAAEARAALGAQVVEAARARLECWTRETYDALVGALRLYDAAIAETAQKTTETSDNGNRESHPRASKDGVVRIETSRLAEAPQEPGTSSPDNAERPDRVKGGAT